MVPGVLRTVTPCRAANPERGLIWPSLPGGRAIAMPVGIIARPCGAISTGASAGTAAIRSSPAASALWYCGNGKSAACGSRMMRTSILTWSVMPGRSRFRTHKRRGDALDQKPRYLALRLRRPRFDAVWRNQVNDFDVAAHDPGRRRHIVGQDPVAAFPGELGFGIGNEVVSLRGKTDDEARPAGFAMRDCRQDVRVFGERQRRRATGLLLDLAVAWPLGAPIGDGGGEDRDIGGQGSLDCLEHLARSLDLFHRDAQRVWNIDRPADHHDLGAGGGRCRGDSVALLARRAVGNITHRINRLVGRP